MTTLRPYLPALTLSIYACTADPSPPGLAASSTEPGDAGATAIQSSESPQTAVTSIDPSSSSVAPGSSQPSSVVNSSAIASPDAGSITSPNVSEVDAAAPLTTGTPEQASSQENSPDEEPPLTDPIGTRNFACDPSPSPMFHSDEVLEMRIAADFSVVNGSDKETATSPGSLDPDGAGPLAAIPVEVQARGISRFRECGFRPFKVKFSEKQKDNVFHKLGKSVKFSTHCGDRAGMHDILKAPSLEEYYQRVRMEHLVYQLLTPLQTMSLATRLVNVTYLDTSTGTEQTHLAFVREPEDELGQRCGMAEGEDIPDVPTQLNDRANLLLYLLNNFVIQADVKNRFDLVDVAQQLRAPVPYDFDLLGIFRREYLGLDGRTLAQNAEAFADWLRRNQSPALHEEVRLLLSKSSVMRQLIAEAGLTTVNRALFDEWLDSFLAVLGTFEECEASEQDSNATACYVADDHADTVEDATTVQTGEHSLLLEPPGDRDAVRFELAPSTLYTFTTHLNATVRSPDGSVVGRLGEEGTPAVSAVSFRTEAGGFHSLELNRGNGLVCSDMWSNSEEALAQPYAIYEDDHGGALANATRLEPNTVTAGYFELNTLQGLFDEDWFLVKVDPATQVFVDSDGVDSAMLEVYSADDLSAPLDTYFFNTQGAREELTALFPATGDYVLRAIQGWDQASYSLELATTSE